MVFAKIGESCGLIQGMAQRLGRDIAGTVGRDPQAQAAGYRAAVLRCASCTEHSACQTLQDENARLDQAPDYCRNSWV